MNLNEKTNIDGIELCMALCRLIHLERMKNVAVNATAAIADGVSSLLDGSKVKRLEMENEGLRQDITNLQRQAQAERREQMSVEHRHSSEINKIDWNCQQKIAEYDNRLKRIDNYFPDIKELLPMAESGAHGRNDKAAC